MRDSTKTLAVTSLAHFTNDGTLAIFPLLYPVFVSTYSLSTISIAILASLLSVFSIGASPFIGKKSDSTKNRRTLLAFGLVLIAVGIAGYSASGIYLKNVGLLLFLIPFTAIAGIGSSFYHPIGAAMLNEKWGSTSRGRVLGINGSFGSLGRAIYPILAVALVASFALSSISLLAIFALVVAAVVVITMRDGLKVSRNDSQQAPKRLLKSPTSTKILLSSILALTVLTFLRAIFISGILAFLPIYLTQNGLKYGFELGLVISIMNGMGMVSQPLLGHVADRFGRRLTLGIANLGAIVSMLLFLHDPSSVLGYFYLIVFGLCTSADFPLLLALAHEISPEDSSTIGGSIVWNVGSGGGAAAGPLLIGLMSAPGVLGSLGSSFFVVTLIGTMSVLLLPLVPKPKSSYTSEIVENGPIVSDQP